jgi:hypothetical protein
VEVFEGMLQYEEQIPIILDVSTLVDGETYLCLAYENTFSIRLDGTPVNKGELLFYYYGRATNGEDTPAYAPGTGTVHYEKRLKEHLKEMKAGHLMPDMDSILPSKLSDGSIGYYVGYIDGGTKTREKLYAEQTGKLGYQWQAGEENQRRWVLNHVLPSTKEDLLELLVFTTGKINRQPKTLYEETWNNVWKRKSKQIYAKARLCLKTDQGTLKSLEEILAENGVM